jgi:hypothetical protein
MGQATPFQTEAWAEYGIGTVVILLRIFARFKVVGIRNWQGDDYFAFVTLAFWTVSSSLCPDAMA